MNNDTSINQSGIFYVPDPALGDTQELDLDVLARAIAEQEKCSAGVARGMIVAAPSPMRMVYGRGAPLLAGDLRLTRAEWFEFWDTRTIGSFSPQSFFLPYDGLQRTPERRYYNKGLTAGDVCLYVQKIGLFGLHAGQRFALDDGLLTLQKSRCIRWDRPLDRFVKVFDGAGLYEQAIQVDVNAEAGNDSPMRGLVVQSEDRLDVTLSGPTGVRVKMFLGGLMVGLIDRM